MVKHKSFSSLLFSSLLVILAASGLVSCEDALTPQEYPPLPNEGPLGEGGEDPLGYWRIEGIIDAPLDWTPSTTTVQIWMSAFGGGLDQLEENISFTLLFTGQTSKRWAFNTEGDYYWWGDIYHLFFIPDPTWWSDPEHAIYRHTYVRGYTWVEFGGGWALVLADEDTSYSPFNPPSAGPDWKYYQPYLEHGQPGCDLYWAWDTVYLDLR
jgi:hypothetical protein